MHISTTHDLICSSKPTRWDAIYRTDIYFISNDSCRKITIHFKKHSSDSDKKIALLVIGKTVAMTSNLKWFRRLFLLQLNELTEWKQHVIWWWRGWRNIFNGLIETQFRCQIYGKCYSVRVLVHAHFVVTISTWVNAKW